ncbi:MAG: hypothetical protein ACLF0P_08010 [Thermoanaerobaculia bacterium]
MEPVVNVEIERAEIAAIDPHDPVAAYENGTLFERLEAHPPEEIPGLRKDERVLLAFLRASRSG